METILFTFEETKEEVEFAVLGSVDYNEEVYLLVVDKSELELDDMTAYVIKAIEQENDDVIYEIVDEDEELIPVSEKLMNGLEDFEIDM